MRSLDRNIIKKIEKARLILGHLIEIGDSVEGIGCKVVAGDSYLDLSFLDNVDRLFVEFPDSMQDIELKFPKRVGTLENFRGMYCSYSNIEGLENVERFSRASFYASTFNCKVKISTRAFNGFNSCTFNDDVIIQGLENEGKGALKNSSFMNYSTFNEGVNIYIVDNANLPYKPFNNLEKLLHKVVIRYKTFKSKGVLTHIYNLITMSDSKVYIDFSSARDITFILSSSLLMTSEPEEGLLDRYILWGTGKIEARLPDVIERGIIYHVSLASSNIELVGDKGKANVLHLGKKGLKRCSLIIGKYAFKSSRGIKGLELEDSVVTYNSSFEGMKDLVLAKICGCHIFRGSGKHMVPGYREFTKDIPKGSKPGNFKACYRLFRNCKKLERVMIDLSEQDLKYTVGWGIPYIEKYLNSEYDIEDREKKDKTIVESLIKFSNNIKVFEGCESLKEVIVTVVGREIGRVRGEQLKLF